MDNPIVLVDPDGRGPETIWDAISIVYDIGKIGVGYATGNPAMVTEGGIDSMADVGALLVPGLPAGSTKAARILVGRRARQILEGIGNKSIRVAGDFTKGMADVAGLKFLDLNLKGLADKGVNSINDLAKLNKSQRKKIGIHGLEFDGEGNVKAVIKGDKRYRLPSYKKKRKVLEANYEVRKEHNGVKKSWAEINRLSKEDKAKYVTNTHVNIK